MLLYCVTLLACTTYGLHFCMCLKACVSLCPREPYLILVIVLATRPETREEWCWLLEEPSALYLYWSLAGN